MSSPKLYIPFNWPKFQSQTHGWNSEQKWSYWVACCSYYWQGCVGIDNDEETMKITCEVYETSKWALIRARVFQGRGYFFLENGKWHQDFAREEWNRGVDIMKKRSDQTETARLAAIQKASEKRMSKSVTVSVTGSVTGVQSEPESVVVTGVSPSPSPSPVLNKGEAVASPPAPSAEPVKKRKEMTDKQKAAFKVHKFNERVTTLWNARWAAQFPTIKYRFDGPDYNRLKSFTELNPDITPEQIVNLAARAWQFKAVKNFSHCSNAGKVAYVCSHFTDIEKELSNENVKPTNPRNAGIAGDSAARAAATAAFVARQQRERQAANEAPM